MEMKTPLDGGGVSEGGAAGRRISPFEMSLVHHVTVKLRVSLGCLTPAGNFSADG